MEWRGHSKVPWRGSQGQSPEACGGAVEQRRRPHCHVCGQVREREGGSLVEKVPHIEVSSGCV